MLVIFLLSTVHFSYHTCLVSTWNSFFFLKKTLVSIQLFLYIMKLYVCCKDNWNTASYYNSHTFHKSYHSQERKYTVYWQHVLNILSWIVAFQASSPFQWLQCHTKPQYNKILTLRQWQQQFKLPYCMIAYDFKGTNSALNGIAHFLETPQVYY